MLNPNIHHSYPTAGWALLIAHARHRCDLGWLPRSTTADHAAMVL